MERPVLGDAVQRIATSAARCPSEYYENESTSTAIRPVIAPSPRAKRESAYRLTTPDALTADGSQVLVHGTKVPGSVFGRRHLPHGWYASLWVIRASAAQDW